MNDYTVNKLQQRSNNIKIQQSSMIRPQQNQNHHLLYQWISQQIQHSNQKVYNSIFQSFNQDNTQKWISLIKYGFIRTILTDIDCDHFTAYIKHQQQPIQTQYQLTQELNSYWQSIHSFLKRQYKRKLNEQYKKNRVTLICQKSLEIEYQKKLSILKTQLQYSIIELVKLLFYILVQMHNNKQQLLEAESQQTIGLQSEIKHTITQANDSLSDDNKPLLTFLSRVCKLSQQIQQYLVSVVEQIQQSSILQRLQPQQHYDRDSMLQQSKLHNLYRQKDINLQQNGKYNKRNIYREIQHINQENQELKQKIEQIIEENQKLQNQMQQNITEQNKLIKKINQYNDEKQELFQFLKYQQDIDINSLQQFIEVVKHLEQQNELLQNTIAQIEQRNYELQKQNAQKVHKLNKSAIQITKVTQQIGKFKQKIKGLKQDIQYLDQFVNNGNDFIVNINNNDQQNINQHINAQLVTSFDVQNQQEMIFNKSIDLDQRHSYGNVLRQNMDIFNQKLPFSNNKTYNMSNRVLSDSITGVNILRQSYRTNQKSSKPKNMLTSVRYNQQNQQNVQPFSQTEQQNYKLNEASFQSISSVEQSSFVKVGEQELLHQLMIEQQKQRYRNDLVKKLQSLYKQISDLTNDITSIKEENKKVQKKNKISEKKLADLKNIHELFVRELYNK